MSKNKLELVEFLKGFSILTIILYHLIDGFWNVPNFVKMISSYGGAGVHVFFICSGFGLFYSYLNKGFSLSDYVRKRFVKVYVPYIVIICISFLFSFMYYGEDRIVALLSHIFLFKMFFSKYEMSFGIQMWYVSTLFQFYFIFPILLKVLKKLKIQTLFFSSFLISLVWATFLSVFRLNDNIALNYFFLQYLWEFVLGMYLAYQFWNHKLLFCQKWSNFKIIFIFILTFLIYGFMSLKGGFLKNYNDVFSAVSFLSLAILCYRLKFLNVTFLFLGKYSYEIYLIHYLIFCIVFRFFNLSIIINSVISLILVILLSMLYYRLFHRKGVVNYGSK